LPDIEQAKLTLKLLRREEIPNQTPTAEKYPIDLYGTHEWFYSLLSEVIDAFETGDEDSLSNMHAELHETFTPVQNRLYLIVLEASRPKL